jgi:hypothetical protein
MQKKVVHYFALVSKLFQLGKIQLKWTDFPEIEGF